MEPVYIMAHSPLRLPSWRYQRAVQLLEQRRRIRPEIDDTWVARIKTFLAANGASPTQHSESRHRKRDQAVADAFAIYNGPKASRALLESYLLTSARRDTVAARCQLTSEVVEAYQAIFFCVRNWLNARDWIAAKAIGIATPEGLRAEYPFRLWRLLAFNGGQDVLETLVAVMSGNPLVPPPGLSFAAATTWQRETELRIKLHVASLLAETPMELAAVARIGNAAPRAGVKRGRVRKKPDTVLKIMGSFLSGLERSGTRRRRRPQQRHRLAKPRRTAEVPEPIELAFRPLIS